MSKVKEIFGKTANELAHKTVEKAFKEHQKQFMIRIKEIAEQGVFSANFSAHEYAEDWERLSEWLRSLGFYVTRPVNGCVIWVKWDDNSLAKNTMTTELTKTSHIEFEWIFDPHPYDYVCSCCKEHSEYKTKYCPNCGAKMKGE